jgi:hypothetical protein
MKKILLVCFLFAAFNFTKVNAQILNPGFENWTTGTANFDGFGGFFPPETFTYSDPTDWTTTNALTGADTLGNFFFITQTSTAHTGTSAIQLTTDTLKTVGTPLGPRRLTIPGLALNGSFPLDLGSNLLAGGVISPIAVPGAGQPWTKRLASVKGFYDYVPVFNDSLGHIDSCMIWAILRKGDKQIASAQFVSGAVTGGYQPFTANFQYSDCEAPDTLVILIAASVPNFGSILTGSTKLVAGSILRVDDLDFDTLAASFNYPPIANVDADTTTKNNAKNVFVKLNDEDCNDAVAGLALAVTTAPLHGTAVPAGTTHITYTPDNNYVGIDSFFYTLNDGTATSAPARVRVVIFNATSINEANQVPVTIYPVPAANQLNIQFENNGRANLRMFDMLGNLVLTSVMTKNNNSINIETLANGVYGIQITDENNAVIARSKFTISK